MATPAQLEELLSVKLKLRQDVRCAIHEAGDEPYFQIEDPLNGNFYRLGVREWNLARKLNGQRTLQQLIDEQDAQGDRPPLSVEEAISLGRWLIQTQLATQGDGFAHPLFARPTQSPAKMPAWLNPAFLRIPLGNPDGILSRVAPAMLWAVSPIAIVLWAACCLFGGYEIAMQWQRFREPLQTVLAPDNWAYLLMVWVVLKVIHEFFHGLVCKKYGGRVPSCGVMLILFSPVAFVDVTSSWKFRSRWQRIFTAAAGMYSELFIAAIAAVIWARTDQPLLSQMCHNVILTAGVSTLLFNGNFLMRFDGYYILTDLLGVQNLYASGQQFVRYFSRRYLLGMAAKPLGESRFLGLIKTYGVASLIWRISFYIGILLTAATMFRGVGVLISATIGLAWIVLPTIKFLIFLVRGEGNERPHLGRLAAVFGTLTAVVVGGLMLPWPGGITASGVVEYEPLSVVHASADGFLRTWDISPGQRVDTGQQLAQIENKQTELEMREVQGRIERSEIELMVLRDEKKYELLGSKTRDLEAMRDERAQLEEQLGSLCVTAPSRGRVIVRDPDSLVDQYIEMGEPLLAVGQEDQKSVVVLVAQKDADFFLKQLGSSPRVRIRGRLQRVRGTQLTKVNPRATKTLRHAGLAAPNGGPLAVVPRPTQADGEPSAEFELVEPHFTATVTLSAAQSALLRAGEIARVRVGAAGETIGAHLWASADRWIRSRLTPAQF